MVKKKDGTSSSASATASSSSSSSSSSRQLNPSAKESVDNVRRKVIMEVDRVENVSSSDFPSNFPDESDELAWDLNKFKQTFDITNASWSADGKDLEFDLIGVDASFANAIRRILIAEVPTMAIEEVFIKTNTSIIHDEALAHRFGLIPIKADARNFFQQSQGRTDVDTLVFSIGVKCERNPALKSNATASEEEKYVNTKVFSNLIKWVPQGRQIATFGEDAFGMVHDDILLAKLRSGQEISATLACRKGLGREHIKWSPVGTASYRLLPEIIIKRPIMGKDAEEFKSLFPAGVIELRENRKGEHEAYVANARLDTCSREVLRSGKFKDAVRLQRVRDHFLFSIESIGAVPPEDLLEQSVTILRSKVQVILDSLNEQMSM